jgi:hypothetical protein
LAKIAKDEFITLAPLSRRSSLKYFLLPLLSTLVFKMAKIAKNDEFITLAPLSCRSSLKYFLLPQLSRINLHRKSGDEMWQLVHFISCQARDILWLWCPIKKNDTFDIL